jgi:galactokinase
MRDFLTLFGRPPTATADAPGRVNLIGEHTDYNGGFVLPTAIPQRSTVELAPRDGGRVRVASAELDGGAIREYRLRREQHGGDWLDYVQGCTVALARAGYRIGGFDARLRSRVPIGAGVSSSAALEVSVLRALRAAFRLDLDDVALALVAHRAEHDFVGARVGVMDQMAASLADERTALFLDTRSLDYERVPLPADAALVVIDSGIAHHHPSGDYNTRREECERACVLLGVAQLRDLSRADLPRLDALPEPIGRRARHVITENARVLEAVAALRAGALAELGLLLDASHASQRDDYEVSVPEIDVLVALARADPRVLGARLTGGGFGGAIVVLTRARAAEEVAARTVAAYESCTRRHATILVPDESSKAR